MCSNLTGTDQKKIDATNVNNVIGCSKHSLIIGNGGLGKSTILRHFFLNMLELKLPFIPVIIDLRNMKLRSVETSTYTELCDLGLDIPHEKFLYALKQGMFFLMYDGLDEVDAENYNSVVYQLSQLRDRYPQNYMIITSRPISNSAENYLWYKSISEGFINLARFSILYINAFTKKQAIDYIIQLKYDTHIQKAFATDLETSLYDSHTDFASNPLLLSIMLLTYEDFGDIPNKIHIFYSNAFSTLYSRHDATKTGFVRRKKSKLSRDVFEKVFSFLCFKTYMEEIFEFDFINVKEALKSVGNDIDFDLYGFIDDLVFSLGVLIKESNRYRFIHRSFQEFYCAKYINNLLDNDTQKYIAYLVRSKPVRILKDDLLKFLNDLNHNKYENVVIQTVIDLIDEEFEKEKRPRENMLKHILSRVLIARENKSKEPFIPLFVYRFHMLDESKENFKKPMLSIFPMMFEEFDKDMFGKFIKDMSDEKKDNKDTYNQYIRSLSAEGFFDKNRVGIEIQRLEGLYYKLKRSQDSFSKALDFEFKL